MTTLERYLNNHPALTKNGTQEYFAAVWGGVAVQYDALRAEIDKITINAIDVANLSGGELDEVVQRFTGIRRLVGEEDSALLRLLDALFVRNNIPSWTTVHGIRRVFSYFAPSNLINIIENEIETNLIADGEFESFTVGVKSAPFGSWTPSGSSISIDGSGAFQGAKCLHGVGTGTVYTSAAATAGCFVVSAAHKGYCPLKIQRTSDNYYYNFSTKTWAAAVSQLLLENATDEYITFDIPILVAGSHTLKIIFGPDASGRDYFIDRVTFGAKPSYPYIHILVSTFIQAGDYLNNWVGSTDPVAGTDYENATFLGQDFIGGEGSGVPTEYYVNILDIVKPAGVRADFSFVGRT